MYLKIPRYQEAEEVLQVMRGGVVYVEEKVDGQIADGVDVALVEMEGMEVFFFRRANHETYRFTRADLP